MEYPEQDPKVTEEDILNWSPEQYINKFMYWNFKRFGMKCTKTDAIFLGVQLWKRLVNLQSEIEDDAETDTESECDECSLHGYCVVCDKSNCRAHGDEEPGEIVQWDIDTEDNEHSVVFPAVPTNSPAVVVAGND